MIDEKRFRELLAEGGADEKLVEKICTQTGGLPLQVLIFATFETEQDVLDAIRWHIQEADGDYGN
jgi:hypothetical protein